MKTINNVIFILVLSGLTIVSGFKISYAQNSKKDHIKDLINSKKYAFKAQFAISMRGRSRTLTSDYDLIINKDSISAYLPYFGRAYSAPLNPSEGGIKFTTKKFDYSLQNRKKGGWMITIKPENNKNDVSEMILTTSETGYASLQVISYNRDPISFNGIVTDIKEEKSR